jgi:hypothetical protein
MIGFICSTPLYQYGGWLFEYNPYIGPWPVRKDGEPYKRAGERFFKLFDEWSELPDKEKYRIGGGCERI